MCCIAYCIAGKCQALLLTILAHLVFCYASVMEYDDIVGPELIQSKSRWLYILCLGLYLLLDLSQFNFSISNYLPTPILIAYLLKTISEHFLSSCKSLIYIYRNKYSYIHRRLHDELRLLTETLIETSQLN